MSYSRSRSQKKIKRIKSKRAKKGSWGTFLYFLYGTVIILSLLFGIVVGGGYLYIVRGLPKISSLQDYNPPIISTVYSHDNRKIGEFCREKRIIVPTEKIPKMLVDAFIASEDARFYKHEGIDFFSILRALFKNIEAGTIVQGGSTITQQVTKSLLLSPERSYLRKVREAILAYRIEKSLTKEEILYVYLNQIYLGHGAYGIEAAAENYFSKTCSELNLAECALLAGLPQAPSRYSPLRNFKRAKERQVYVLNRMLAEGYITNIQATEAINTPLDIKPRHNWYIEQVPYYTEHVRRYIEEKYGKKTLYEEGLKVYTAVSIEMQNVGRNAIQNGLSELDKRQGYRGPLKHLPPEEFEDYSQKVRESLAENPLEPGKVTEGLVIAVDDEGKNVTVRIGGVKGILPLEHMGWARKPDPDVLHINALVSLPSEVLSPGDVILVRIVSRLEDEGKQETEGEPDEEENKGWILALEQVPEVEGALLCMEAETGLVRAIIGGRDFRTSQFNRAIQSKRQPGSAFKPIIYAAALDRGYTPATMILDAPIVFEDTAHDFVWKPKNYEDKFYGPTLFRNALAHSRNVVTIKILKDIGIDYVIDYAGQLGIESPINRDLSIALGSSGTSPLELVRAYSVFAHQGYRMVPIFVTKVVDRKGNILEENNPEGESVISKETAYIVTNLLQGVVKEGTGRKVRSLNRPVAGKTGTTNNLYDAWFLGYTPCYVTGVWVGFDNEKPLGKRETGARAAIPIWLSFMKEILADKPIRVFPVPNGIVFAKIDTETGLLAIPESKKTIFECFKEGSAPTEYTERPGSITEQGQFFKSDM
jgi:penicillin-binding protein 1A